MRVVIVAEWYIVANCYSAMREHSGIVGDLVVTQLSQIWRNVKLPLK